MSGLRSTLVGATTAGRWRHQSLGTLVKRNHLLAYRSTLVDMMPKGKTLGDQAILLEDTRTAQLTTPAD